MVATILLIISLLIFTDEDIHPKILSEQKVRGKTNAKIRYPDSHHITQIFFSLISCILKKGKKEILNHLND